MNEDENKEPIKNELLKEYSFLRDAPLDDLLKLSENFIIKVDRGRVYKVYDGDTINIIANYAGRLFRFSVRIFGIDTPELRSKNEEEKKAAKIAKDFVHGLCYNQIVYLRDHIKEKYGRVCARVFLPDGREIANLLKTRNLGLSYYGGKKKKFQAASPNESTQNHTKIS